MSIPLPNPLRTIDTDPDYSDGDADDTDGSAGSGLLPHAVATSAPNAASNTAPATAAPASIFDSTSRSGWRSRHNARRRLKAVESSELELQRVQLLKSAVELKTGKTKPSAPAAAAVPAEPVSTTARGVWLMGVFGRTKWRIVAVCAIVWCWRIVMMWREWRRSKRDAAAAGDEPIASPLRTEL